MSVSGVLEVDGLMLPVVEPVNVSATLHDWASNVELQEEVDEGEDEEHVVAADADVELSIPLHS